MEYLPLSSLQTEGPQWDIHVYKCIIHKQNIYQSHSYQMKGHKWNTHDYKYTPDEGNIYQAHSYKLKVCNATPTALTSQEDFASSTLLRKSAA